MINTEIAPNLQKPFYPVCPGTKSILTLAGAPRSPFADELLRLRKKLDLTQEDVAYILGISKKTVENFENDRVKPLAITQEGALGRLYAYQASQESS